MIDRVGKKLLLVEDEAIQAMDEKIQLEKYGYSVVIANTGERAVEIVRSDPEIDLVLMDIDLGRGIDGTEAALLILADYELPVVFLSSHTDPEIVGKSEKITSYGYVVKNSSITVLDASIKMAFKLFESNSRVKEAKKHLEAIIESTQDLIWSVDPDDYGLIAFNQSLSDYFIAKQNLAIQPGMRPADLFSSPEAVDIWVDLYGKALKYGSYKSEYLSLSGGMVLELTINTIESRGKIIALSVFGKDITKQKEYELELLAAKNKANENESRFRAFIEQAPLGIGVFDLAGYGLYANESFLKIVGLNSNEEMVGKPGYVYFTPEYQEKSKERIQRRMQGLPVPAEFESVVLRPDGTELPVRQAVSPITLADKTVSISFISAKSEQPGKY
jgi:PAS domain S-box-containing protein